MVERARCRECGTSEVAGALSDGLCPRCAPEGPRSAASTASAAPGVELPRQIGDYRILRKLGEGGMGVVYEAEQHHPRRAVALKVILGGRYVDESQVKLFRREAQTLARLNHPGIASIYESGRTDDGQHFFAMELVRGTTLGRYLQKRESGHGLSAGEVEFRLALFRKICEAVSYAHQRGVIHRDLKPSNILVADDSSGSSGDSPDRLPTAKVLDFGLARITDTDLSMSTMVTDAGKIRGTLPYMSPEQIRGNPDEIDVRSDVYSLGVLLYEMLTGQLPYEVRGLPVHDVARVINDEPPHALTRSWSGPAKPSRDLATIVSRALEKERSRRYQSVTAMSGDVERYQTSQPILARPPSTVYQLSKLVGRHKFGFAVAAGFVALLAVAAVGFAIQANRTAAERDRANQEARTSHEIAEFLVGLFEVPDPFGTSASAITAREILDRGSERIARALAGQPVVQARLMETMGRVYQNLGVYDRGESMLVQAVSRLEREVGPDDPVTARARSRLGRIRWYLGDLDAGRADLNRALAAQQRRLGPDHLDVAWTLYYQGTLAAWAGDHDEGLALLDRARRIFESQLGPDDLAVAWCLNDRAYVQATNKEYDEALRSFRRALEIKERALPPDHPDVVVSLNNVAWVLIKLGRFDEAREYLARALASAERRLGQSHPARAVCLHTLGELEAAAGNHAKALDRFEQALEIQRGLYDSEHHRVLATLASMAGSLRELGRHAEAKELLFEVLSIRERTLEPDHPDLIQAREAYEELSRDQPVTASPEEVSDEHEARVGGA